MGGEPVAKSTRNIMKKAKKKTTKKSASRAKARPTRPAGKSRPAASKRASGPALPSYDALPVRPGAPEGSAWGLFGDEDQVGTINLLTPQRVLDAARTVRSGKV